MTPDILENTTDLYLDLMKRCLLNYVYKEAEESDGSSWTALEKIKMVWTSILVNLFGAKQSRYSRRIRHFNESSRASGKDWPKFAHTMIGEKRLDNIRFCIEDILKNNIRGDFVETGVWRGGATIFMRAVLKAYGITDRTVWVADSFEGLPPPETDKYAQDKGDIHFTYEDLKISLPQVQENFRRYGLLDDQVKFLQGWFKDTLPASPIRTLALLRVDCDMYGSTMDVLTSLYPKLSAGGYVIVDDYGAISKCREAVETYRKENNITDPIHGIDWTGIYWQRHP